MGVRLHDGGRFTLAVQCSISFFDNNEKCAFCLTMPTHSSYTKIEWKLQLRYIKAWLQQF